MARPGLNPPYGRWMDAHREQLSKAQMTEISRWHTSVYAPNKGLKQLLVMREWIADRNQPLPDLLFFYGNYGRLVLYGHYFISYLREQPPILLSAAEQDAWRSESRPYAFTTQQISEELSVVFNSFCLRVVEGGEDLIYQLTKQQLEQGLRQLDEMLSGNMAQKYTPTQFTAEDVENGEDNDPYEYNQFKRPLALRSLLEGIMAALPFIAHKLREPHPGRPEYGLPRAALADKLEALVGNETRQRLSELDDRLRQLLEFWYQHKHSGAKFYYSFNYDPELIEFWWWHWPQERKKFYN